MTQLVLDITRSKFGAIVSSASQAHERLAIKAPTRNMIILCAILCTLQVLDGILTGIGVYHMGTGMEGNMFLRWVMESIGQIPALVLVKSIAVFVVIVLAYLSSVVEWIATAMQAMIVLYVVAAIIPWTAILLTRFA